MSNQKNIRSSQLVSTFGIGQIMNFPNDVSVLIGGLNLWKEEFDVRQRSEGNMNWDDFKIREPRLQRALRVKYFIRPFDYRTSSQENRMLYIPAVRFPGWHHCVKCGRMVKRSLGYQAEPAKCECGSKMIPVRFVAACPEGHIQDVPFEEWVHNGKPCANGTPQLTYQSFAGSGDLSSIYIKCHCNKTRSLAGLMNVGRENGEVYNSALASIGLADGGSRASLDNPNNQNEQGEYCRGEKPWLGVKGIRELDECGSHLHVLIRGGTNVHYPMVRSALFLPQQEDKSAIIEEIVKEHKTEIEELWNADKLRSMIRIYLRGIHQVKTGSVEVDEVIAYLENQGNQEEEEVINEHKLRYEEYNFILDGRGQEGSEFKATSKNIDNYDDHEFLGQYIDRIILVERLKETRVFTGFRRIDSYNSQDYANVNELKKKLSTKHVVDWLPATEVYGEGIFIKFRDDVIDTWLKKQGKNLGAVLNRYHGAMQRRFRDYEDRPLSPAFIMMHTFAHTLIKRLCFNCGYGTSALRERLYFSAGAERMNGIMIYTSSGDSEGSLGGLVKQGTETFFGKLFKEAIEDARWCSADPVCSDIGQRAGQGPDNVNGSACHNCCILPETSCEEFNQLLDRATITGTLDHPEWAFFKEDNK
jgi:hypothetical protein